VAAHVDVVSRLWNVISAIEKEVATGTFVPHFSGGEGERIHTELQTSGSRDAPEISSTNNTLLTVADLGMDGDPAGRVSAI